MSSWPLLAVCGQQHDDAEVVARWFGAASSRGCRRSPATTGTGSRGRSGCARRAARGRRPRGRRTRRAGARGRRPRARCAVNWTVDLAGRRGSSGSASASPAVASQRSAKWAATSRDDRAAQQRARVVPADRLLLVRVRAGVVAVARERREVDAADEGELVVDDHELLVVAVHHPRARVQLALDLRAVASAARARPSRSRAAARRPAPARPPTRSPAPGSARRSRPAASRTGGSPCAVPGSQSRRIGLEVPGADVDVALRAADRLGHPRERVGAVDQHLHRVAVRAAARPSAPTGPRSPAPARRAARGGAIAACGDGSSRARCRRRRRRPRGRESGPPCLLAYPLLSPTNMASDQSTPQRLAAIREQMSLLSDYL